MPVDGWQGATIASFGGETLASGEIRDLFVVQMDDGLAERGVRLPLIRRLQEACGAHLAAHLASEQAAVKLPSPPVDAFYGVAQQMLAAARARKVGEPQPAADADAETAPDGAAPAAGA